MVPMFVTRASKECVALNAVERELTGDMGVEQVIAQLLDVNSFAFKHRDREVSNFQNFLVHLLFEFLAIVLLHFVKNFHRVGPHRNPN